MRHPRLIAPAAALLLLGACYDAPQTDQTAEQTNTRAPVASIIASTTPEGQAIDRAEFVSGPDGAVNPASRTAASTMSKADQAKAVNGPATGIDQSREAQRRRVLIKAQVLLDRAHFGPGVINGEDDETFQQALAAFERARGLPEDGELDAQVWNALKQADNRPIMQDYTISVSDVQGPFAEEIPDDDYKALSEMERLSYTSPLEALAEKFHMDQALLEALNPEADFTMAGTQILVAAPVTAPLPRVQRVEVHKAQNELRAFDASGRLVAVYPTTVGSTEMPTPTGEWEVTAVAHDPVWNYDPAKLNFGDKSLGKLTIPAGPNNPVGVVWIDLSKDTYGIHGTAEPATIGKTASHGCVRLTNWNAKSLADAVNEGTKVVFVGSGGGQTRQKA